MQSHLQTNFCKPLLLVAVALNCFGGTCTAREDLLERIVETGIGPIGTTSVRLPAPMLDELDTAAERREAAEKLASRLGWDRFAKDSVFAPVAINIDAVKDEAGNRIAHSIHCAFIVHGELAELENQTLLKSILVASSDDDEESGQGSEVPADVLKTNKIAPVADDESFGRVTFPLFNRIEVSGVIHATQVQRDDLMGIAWQFDSRFADSDYASVWRKLTKNNLGHIVEGDPVPYSGCGGYMVVQEVEPGILLVESRMVMHEPKEWFNGSQFLRSKLPPGLQENARSFRRKLADARKATTNKK